MTNTVQVNGFSVLLLRIALSGIFINAGFSHLINAEQTTNRLQHATYGNLAHNFADPYILVIASGYALLIFGMTFLLGIFTRWSALVLLLLLVPITITIQMGNGLMHGPLWKNVALLGGLLFFILNNPKSYCIYNK
ncbi:DoxX family protein [Vaginella massiliensis]|uniref:DoxX family protein n=1 Tax=Vaginella massiliensis TaxID=1816680 RepID=UPI000838F801|nr:DoxX family protein [Vaginella massiliensis]